MGPLVGPLKSIGPGVIVPPAPPLGGPAQRYMLERIEASHFSLQIQSDISRIDSGSNPTPKS